MNEERLEGGNASGEVVRVGATVRKSWTAATESVVEFVTAVRERGVDAPAPLGRDEQGRQIIEFIPGRLAIESEPLSSSGLRRVGALIRQIHDASAAHMPSPHAQWETAIPGPGSDLICHNDLAPWNLIIGDRWVFIDWDAAAPSTRLWDLAYSAQAFALNDADRPPERAAADLAALVDGYGADASMRAALPDTMTARTAAMLDLLATSATTGREPWASMFADGHGMHWARVREYVGEHREVWRRALAG